MNKNTLTLGSLFSGSGGFELGGILAGIKPIWNAEIEPFPIRVTTKRLPGVKRYGDVSKLHGDIMEPVDIITWGSPCQDLSIAGKRAGLSGSRSGLYVEAVRIVDEMLKATNREYPKFCAFENVLGLVSSNKGADFIVCLDMMQDLGFIPDVNIFDAQFMGVPQRRKRVYITWINVDYLKNNRTDITDSITIQLVAELITLYMGGLITANGIPLPKDLSKPLSRYENGIKKRIKLFGYSCEELYDRLKDITGTEPDSVKPLLDNAFALDFDKGINTIFDCFAGLLSIMTAALDWAGFVSSSGILANSMEWAVYVLREIKGYINAGIKYNKGSENMGRDDLLRFYKQKFQENEDAFEQYFGEQCGQEILPFGEGVHWHTAPCGCERQGAAEGAEDGIGTAGKNGFVNDIILNDQGVRRIDVTDMTSTLRAKANHHAPPRRADAEGGFSRSENVLTTCVMDAAGFCTEHSAKARGVGYQEETSPTLREGVVPAMIALESHPNDSRIRIDNSGSIQSLTKRAGTGGGNVPLVMNERQYAMTVSEDIANTLTETDHKGTQCVFEQKKTYDVRFTSEGTRNARQNVYETDTSRTIDTGQPSPERNQGGIAVVEPAICIQGSMIGRQDKNGPKGSGINEDVSFTLDRNDRHAVFTMTSGSYQTFAKEKAPPIMARDYKDPAVVSVPAYGIGRDAFNQGKNALYNPSVEKELQPTIVAKGPGGVAHSFFPQMKAEGMCISEEVSNTLVNGTNPGYQNGVIEPAYTVRRLTPKPCLKKVMSRKRRKLTLTGRATG